MRTYDQYGSVARAHDVIGERWTRLSVRELPMLVDVGDGTIRVHPGQSPDPEVTLTGPPSLVLGLLVGALDVDTARARGLKVDGKIATLRRVQPLIPPTAKSSGPQRRAARR